MKETIEEITNKHKFCEVSGYRIADLIDLMNKNTNTKSYDENIKLISKLQEEIIERQKHILEAIQKINE